nr:translation initiation factor IF-2-like [Anser cygnoides]
MVLAGRQGGGGAGRVPPAPSAAHPAPPAALPGGVAKPPAWGLGTGERRRGAAAGRRRPDGLARRRGERPSAGSPRAPRGARSAPGALGGGRKVLRTARGRAQLGGALRAPASPPPPRPAGGGCGLRAASGLRDGTRCSESNCCARGVSGCPKPALTRGICPPDQCCATVQGRQSSQAAVVQQRTCSWQVPEVAHFSVPLGVTCDKPMRKPDLRFGK